MLSTPNARFVNNTWQKEGLGKGEGDRKARRTAGVEIEGKSGISANPKWNLNTRSFAKERVSE